MERTNQGTICVFVDVYPVYVVAIHWWIQGRGPEAPPPPPALVDQTEAQMVETIPSPVSKGLNDHLPLISRSGSNISGPFSEQQVYPQIVSPHLILVSNGPSLKA